jgi:hypothetical protein
MNNLEVLFFKQNNQLRTKWGGISQAEDHKNQVENGITTTLNYRLKKR